MGPVIVVAAIVSLLAAIILKPKLSMILIWPIWFMYPHNFMYQRAYLPLNIGGDDLFICVSFLVIMIRLVMPRGRRATLGYTFWSAVAFLIILVIANVSSYLLIRGLGDEFVKQSLKGIITILLAYNLLNCIEDLEDYTKLVFVFCFFAGAGAVLVILQSVFPGQLQMFVSAREVQRAWEYGEAARPSGAFLNANNAAVVLGVASLLTLSTFSIESRLFKKPLRIVLLLVMAVAVLATRSRSGFLSLMIPLSLMGILDKRSRGYAWMFIVLGAGVMFLLPGMRSALIERFAGSPTAGNVGFWEPILMPHSLSHREV